MNAEAQTFSASAFEDCPISLMARVLKGDGTPMVVADIDSIAYKIYDETDVSTPLVNGTLEAVDVISDTLQTPVIWTADGTGYKFRYDSPAGDRPNGGRTYRYEFVFTFVDGSTVPVVFEITTVNLLGS